MHWTDWKKILLQLMTCIALAKSLPSNENNEDEVKYVISLDMGSGDASDEKTYIYHANQPKEVSPLSLSKYKSLIFKRQSQLMRKKKSPDLNGEYEYNYDELKKDYYEEINEVEKDGSSFNYTEEKKPEETLGDSVKNILDFQSPVNCSNEENINIGIQAMSCLWHDYWQERSAKIKNALLKRSICIVGIWILIYLAVVIPLWCTKGWCCCCCCCKVCKPRREVMKAKRYLYENTPGEIILPNGGIEYYEPTEHEKESYRQLQYAIKYF